MEHQNINRNGKVYKERNEENSINILELCEVRWKDKGVRMSEGYKIIYPGGNKHEHGIAVLLDKETTESIN